MSIRPMTLPAMSFRPSSTATRRWPEGILVMALQCAALLVLFSGYNMDNIGSLDL